MKIGRNAPCTCGSGKKYKFCCLGKSNQQKYFEAVAGASSNLKNEARIKVCLHPDKQNCNDKIIKAHAIQNNRILKKLCVDGELITTDGQSHLIFQDTQKKGRKIATTFTGFCGYHDKTTFQEIEDKEFEGTVWHGTIKRKWNNSMHIVLLETNCQTWDMCLMKIPHLRNLVIC